MILTIELSLILLLFLGLGVWAILSGLRQSRRQQSAPISAQALAALAQPYRSYMGEALGIYRDVQAQAEKAPDSVKHELQDLAQRLAFMVKRALPRAEHGTQLAAYLLKLEPSEAQFEKTQMAEQKTRAEFEAFLMTLKTLRGKVYQVLTDASSLRNDAQLEQDLEDALFEVDALEQAFRELNTP